MNAVLVGVALIGVGTVLLVAATRLWRNRAVTLARPPVRWLEVLPGLPEPPPWTRRAQLVLGVVVLGYLGVVFVGSGVVAALGGPW